MELNKLKSIGLFNNWIGNSAGNLVEEEEEDEEEGIEAAKCGPGRRAPRLRQTQAPPTDDDTPVTRPIDAITPYR